jgi:hypothetical protein
MIVQLIGIASIAFLLLILAATQTDATLVRARLDVKEPFTDVSGEPVVSGVPSILEGGYAPAEADISNQRQPYHLLRGSIPDAETDRPGSLTAQTCYETDFQTRFQPLSSYLQRTNNYKRATPDSCSSPMTQFVNSFYKAAA